MINTSVFIADDSTVDDDKIFNALWDELKEIQCDITSHRKTDDRKFLRGIRQISFCHICYGITITNIQMVDIVNSI